MLKNMKLRTVTLVLLLLFLVSIAINAVVSLISLSRLSADLVELATSSGREKIVGGMLDAHYTITMIALIGSTLLAFALVVMLYMTLTRGALTPLRDLSSHFESISQGDLTRRIDDYGTNEVGETFISLRQMQSYLAQTVGQTQQGVIGLSDDSTEIASGNASLGSRIDEQAAALQQTATSMEQMAGTVRQNADNAYQANQLATSASNVAQRGGEVVGEVVTTMNEISSSSEKIAEIVGVIDSIAFQTNILALNAAVEAARAGEQGRGFAVVASEVRALAQRSASAASEITTLIEASGNSVRDGSEQVERAGATMNEIVDAVKRVTDIMGEISAATIEQSSGIDQINMAVSQLDVTTAQNAQMVTETTAATNNMELQVAQLNDVLSGFRTSNNVIEGVARRTPSPSNRLSTPVTPRRAPTQGLASSRGQLTQSAAKSALRRAAQAPSVSKPFSSIPGMDIKGTGSDAPLLRPNLSSKPKASADDEWVEF